MLLKSPNTNAKLEKCSVEIVTWLVELLVGVLQHPFEEEEFDDLLQLAQSANQLWLDMRCQQAFYEFDESFQLGVEFVPDRMSDFKNFLDMTDLAAGEMVVVKEVVARGIVRRLERGMEDLVTVVSKTRVLLEIEKEEEM